MREPVMSNGAKSPATHPATKKATITRLPFRAVHAETGASSASPPSSADTARPRIRRHNNHAAKTLQSVGVNIGGTFSSPKITLGIREAAEEAVKNVVDEQIQKLTGSESLSEEIAKQAENLRAEAKRAGEKLIAAAQEQRAKLVEAAASKGALARIAAEKGGDKLVQEAEKQAANLEAEAERQIEKLTSKKE